MIRILLVHEIHLVCNALANILRDEPDLSVVGFASTPDDALKQLETTQCDVVLINVARPNAEILSFIQHATSKDDAVKIIVLGVSEVKEFIVKCFQAGAVGYSPREDSLNQLLEKIRAIHRGKTVISPEVATVLISRVAELSHFVTNMEPQESDLSLLHNDLTPREQEVLTFIEKGYSNQEIARSLTIEVGTVKNHVHNVLKKLNVSNRKQAAVLARQVLSPQYPVPAVIGQNQDRATNNARPYEMSGIYR